MTYDELVTASLEQMGERPTGQIRWSTNEIKRHVNAAVGYIYDVLDQQYNIQTINTVASSDVYQLNEEMRQASKVYLNDTQILLIDPTDIPVDGRAGQPDRCAIVVGDTGLVSADRYSLIVYPTPEDVQVIDVTYAGVGKLDTGDTIPLPTAYEEPLTWGLSANLAKKLVTNKNSNWATYTSHRNVALAEITNDSINAAEVDNYGWF